MSETQNHSGGRRQEAVREVEPPVGKWWEIDSIC